MTDLYTLNLVGVFLSSLLMIIQIGLNFITVQKAQSDYVTIHRNDHTMASSGSVLSLNEKESLEELRSAY